MYAIRKAVMSLALVLAGFVVCLVLTGRMHWTEDGLAAPMLPEQRQPVDRVPGSAPAQAAFPDFSGIASRTTDSVVNVSSLQAGRRSPFDDEFFRYFFGDSSEFYGSRAQTSLGSGVIISADGYVVTNNHVVGERVREIRAVLSDKREMPGQIVGTDPLTDIALLKLDAKDLPAVRWGDSSKVKVGQWVLAIGSPFQLNQTVTAGIVSAVGRANVGVADYEDFIQTDAAINPGNSGGALIDVAGNLVGINTAIYSQSGGYQGVGFAIPSNLARRIVDDLIKYRTVRRGTIGAIEVTNLTPQLARQIGITSLQGALVWRVSRQVYSQGIEPDDVVVSFDGKPVENATHFLRLVADAPVGQSVTLGLIRGGRKVQVKVPIRQG